MAVFRWNVPSQRLKTARVFDALGQEIRHVVMCDTASGYVERLEMTGEQIDVDECTGMPEVVREHRLSPLIVEWNG